MYDEWAERCRVLGDPTRLHILSLLAVRDGCVCELVALLPVSQSAVSQHLRKLKYGGLVRDYREKSWIFYTLRPDISSAVGAILRELAVADDELVFLRRHHVGERSRRDPVRAAAKLLQSETTKKETVGWRRDWRSGYLWWCWRWSLLSPAIAPAVHC